jgi:hypothetical protein
VRLAGADKHPPRPLTGMCDGSSRDRIATFWGGYSGVFLDPDGHAWEVAHNPHWTLSDDGSISLGP